MKAYKDYAEDIITAFEDIRDSYDTINEYNDVTTVYNNIRKISVDYAIMERADNIYILPSEFGWSDLGTWNSIRDFLKKDDNSNCAIGNVSFVNSKNCTVHIKTNNDFIIKDLNDTFVIETSNGIANYKLNNEGNLEKI